MKFFKIILYCLLFVIVISCEKKNNLDLKVKNDFSEIKKELESIEKWDLINYKVGYIDTTEVNLLTPPLIFAKFRRQFNDTCLTPSLQFYPIELKDYVSEKLFYYLKIRSTFFPPHPKLFQTKNYFIVAWELENYNNLICCDCENLENELKNKLKMSFHLLDGKTSEILKKTNE